ncbi:MAG: GNAT family N-acetyltransferase [Clostridia bacterium]|nr:GNAT family N-acetyltransferase [Clostridia bacterium]
MIIRKATKEDLDGVNSLLYQVQAIHAAGRPDLFKKGAKKYTDEEIIALMNDEKTPIFIYVDGGKVLGYSFCSLQQHLNSNSLTDIKTLYIDDLCVDENARGQHIGKALYDFTVNFAREQGCYNLTLNVWSLNESAQKFYDRLGMKPQKVGMEQIL